MFRYRLRTLMIVLALGPMVLAWLGWSAYLREMYGFHFSEFERHLRVYLDPPTVEVVADRNGNVISGPPDLSGEMETAMRHKALADNYKRASDRPWVILTGQNHR